MNVRGAVFGVALVAAGCWTDDDTLEGTLVGDFEAEGALIEQSCGGAVDSPDPLEVEFSMSVDDDVSGAASIDVYGNVLDGEVSGGVYTFRTSASWTVTAPNPVTGSGGCVVNQRDFFSVTLDGTTLDGTQATDVEPVTGSDCTLAVEAGGGPFLTLPCRVEYILTGNEVLD